MGRLDCGGFGLSITEQSASISDDVLSITDRSAPESILLLDPDFSVAILMN